MCGRRYLFPRTFQTSWEKRRCGISLASSRVIIFNPASGLRGVTCHCCRIDLEKIARDQHGKGTMCVHAPVARACRQSVAMPASAEKSSSTDDMYSSGTCHPHARMHRASFIVCLTILAVPSNAIPSMHYTVESQPHGRVCLCVHGSCTRIAIGSAH